MGSIPILYKRKITFNILNSTFHVSNKQTHKRHTLPFNIQFHSTFNHLKKHFQTQQTGTSQRKKIISIQITFFLNTNFTLLTFRGLFLTNTQTNMKLKRTPNQTTSNISLKSNPINLIFSSVYVHVFHRKTNRNEWKNSSKLQNTVDTKREKIFCNINKNTQTQIIYTYST